MAQTSSENEGNHKMAPGPRKRATRLEFQRRIDYIRKLYEEGREEEIPLYVIEKGLSRATMERYCRIALRQYEQLNGSDTDEKRTIHSSRLKMIFRELVKEGDLRGARQAVTDSARLEGLLNSGTPPGTHASSSTLESRQIDPDLARLLEQVPEDVLFGLGKELINNRRPSNA